jgi:pheromone shutdown protein TraB
LSAISTVIVIEVLFDWVAYTAVVSAIATELAAVRPISTPIFAIAMFNPTLIEVVGQNPTIGKQSEA